MSTVEFNPIPSRERSGSLAVRVVDTAPSDVDAVGIAVSQEGDIPGEIGFSREQLVALGFDAKVGQTLKLPRPDGPHLVAVGVGNTQELDATKLRDAAAAFARATDKYTRVATDLAGLVSVPAADAGQAVVEGVVLARYRYTQLKADTSQVDLVDLALVAGSDRAGDVTTGAERGRIEANAAALGRDLANTPHAYLTATRIAEIAESLAAECNLEVEVFDKEALQLLGCGGLLGVNAGSVEPPRMIKLTYRPANDGDRAGHLAIVGKGVMYDSGGISLKPSNASHATMKTDMSGAAATLAAMTALNALACPVTVTAWLMCTDNMPSGSATALGDVLTIYGGKTVEVMNTDAEGRIVMADALVLATEDKVDAIVDISTLTGAALMALGTMSAAVFGNNQAFVDQVKTASAQTDETVWQLPLDRRYRSQLESDTADLKNMGGEFAGAITAALFLAEFVGDVPWAHLDIAGTAHSTVDNAWRTKGGTGFGTRLLIDLALNFTAPQA